GRRAELARAPLGRRRPRPPVRARGGTPVKLGFLTAAFPRLSLAEVAAWAADAGFETLEIACWPAGSGAQRRYSGVCHVDAERLDDAGAREVGELLAGHGLEISALAYYPNNLAPDPDERRAAHDHLRRVVEAAARLGVDTVGTFV